MTPPEELAALRDRYLDLQLEGDRRGAIRLLLEEGLGTGMGVAELQFEVIGAAQREVGRLWEENRLSVAQEHLATAISQVALAQLYQATQSRATSGRRVLVACVDGDLHDFPARMLADHLDLQGHDVRFLGASVPVDHLIRFIETERPHLVALSVTMSLHAGQLRETVRALKERYPSLPIVAGGHACRWAPGLAREAGAEGCAGDARDAAVMIERVLAGQPVEGGQ